MPKSKNRTIKINHATFFLTWEEVMSDDHTDKEGNHLMVWFVSFSDKRIRRHILNMEDNEDKRLQFIAVPDCSRDIIKRTLIPRTREIITEAQDAKLKRSFGGARIDINLKK
jgi:hypothetical protein